MWSSAELKERAKVALTGTYWKAFAISLIISFLAGGGGGSSGGNAGSSFSQMQDGSGNFDLGGFLAILAIVLGIFAIVFIFAVAFKTFISNPIIVGGRKYFIEAAEAVNGEEQARFGLLGFGFKGNNYMEIVKPMFLVDLYVLLWTLALIIPGIIASYTYKMVPYILADNPNIGTKRALELSKQMTDGEKMDIFILDLSFIGWYLLGLLACCVGVLFVQPYYDSTQAELYRVLREKALDSNMCSFEELGFASPEQDSINSDNEM